MFRIENIMSACTLLALTSSIRHLTTLTWLNYDYMCLFISIYNLFMFNPININRPKKGKSRNPRYGLFKNTIYIHFIYSRCESRCFHFWVIFGPPIYWRVTCNVKNSHFYVFKLSTSSWIFSFQLSNMLNAELSPLTNKNPDCLIKFQKFKEFCFIFLTLSNETHNNIPDILPQNLLRCNLSLISNSFSY